MEAKKSSKPTSRDTMVKEIGYIVHFDRQQTPGVGASGESCGELNKLEPAGEVVNPWSLTDRVKATSAADEMEYQVNCTHFPIFHSCLHKSERREIDPQVIACLKKKRGQI
jgi:hypothetical protein